VTRARVSGVATFREQQVRFAFDQDVPRVNRVIRERQLEVVGGVPLDEWARPSRCAGWSVHDVVRHVAQMNEMVVGVAAAARVGERYHRARRFDPRTTPSEWLAEAPAADPEETLAAYAQSTGAVVEAGGALGGDVLVGTPVGLQVWSRMVLHALFDAVVHERDVTEPLGRSAPAIPEQLPVVAYVLLVAARVACAVDRELAVAIDVGGQVLSVSVQGADVEVVPAERIAACVAAEPLRLLDGLSGRVPLDEVLAAPDDVRAALGMLARNM
jgi:uncharacterized protein (TIGR03083 family)